MFVHNQYVSNCLKTYVNCGVIGGILHTKSLNVNIMYSSSIIGEISIIYYIEPVCYFRNTLSTLMSKLNNATWITFASIRRNFDRKYIEASSMPLCMEWMSVTSFLRHLMAVHERCDSCAKLRWLSCDIVASRVYSSR